MKLTSLETCHFIWMLVLITALDTPQILADPLDNTVKTEKAEASSLNYLLRSSLKRLKKSQSKDTKADWLPKTNTWLASSPTIRMMRLFKQNDGGSDEIEFGINWSIKPPVQKDIESNLQAVGRSISESRDGLQKLYLSGLIREALWQLEIANTNFDFTDNKLKTLRKIYESHAAMEAVKEVSTIGLLLIKQEQIKAKIQLLDYEKEQNYWLKRFDSLTGLSPPDNFEEPELSASNWTPLKHPELQIIENQIVQEKLFARENSTDITPWQVGILANQTKSMGLNDEKFGLSIEIPLTMERSTSRSNANQSIQSVEILNQRYSSMSVTLQNNMDNLIADRQRLLKKQRLLEVADSSAKDIVNLLDSSKSTGEFSLDTILRQIIGRLDTQHQYELARILLKQNNALQRQAAGVIL